jgi:AbrB family looped-hinge helix DNA binding protein
MKAAKVQMDQAGRVVLPKQLRDKLRLQGGDMLSIDVRGGAIELRPMQGAGQLRRVNGVLVFTGSGALSSTEDFVAQSREDRIDELLKRGNDQE